MPQKVTFCRLDLQFNVKRCSSVFQRNILQSSLSFLPSCVKLSRHAPFTSSLSLSFPLLSSRGNYDGLVVLCAITRESLPNQPIIVSSRKQISIRRNEDNRLPDHELFAISLGRRRMKRRRNERFVKA